MNHEILLEKLEIYGCSAGSLTWFASYLPGRKQMVSFRGHLSDMANVAVGVPQGSMLGPLSFIVFMNDMPLNTGSDDPVDMYADDSTVSASGNTLEHLEASLNNDVENVLQWCDVNRMVINTEKTKVMMITTQQRWLKLEKKEPDVFIRGQRLEVVGLHLDRFLTWSTHIKRVHGVVSGYLALLRRIKDCLPRQTRLTFYNCYILPHLDYCITIWGNASSVIRLYRLQKRAARIITDSEYLAPSAPLMRQLRWLPLPQRVQYRQAQLVYRAVNGLAPDYICSMFRPVSEVSSRATRASVRGGGTCVCLWGALASPVTRWPALGQSSGTI